TLHAVVDWSWNLLEPAGRAAMRALSVFPAGFTMDAAGQLLAGDDPGEILGDNLGDVLDDDPGGRPGRQPGEILGDVLDIVEGLVDQSLLTVTDTSSGTRLRMLETVREFSAAEREAAGETDRAVDRFLAWARDFGMAHHDGLFGPDPAPTLERTRAEQDNLL